MEMRGIMGGFYRVSEWIMRLSAINILWVICSIPVFFMLLTMLASPELTTDAILSSLWMIAILSPFTLIPATVAMYGVARKWVMGDTDVPLFKTYFRCYKENYKQAMLGGLLFLVIGVLLIVCIRFYSSQTNALHWLSFLFISFGVVYIGALLNFFSLLVHFHMKLLQLVKNAFIMTMGQPFTSIGILATNAVIVYISTRYTFLIPFFMGSVSAFVTFWYFYRGFQRLQDKAEKAKEKAGELEEIDEDELNAPTKL